MRSSFVHYSSIDLLVSMHDMHPSFKVFPLHDVHSLEQNTWKNGFHMNDDWIRLQARNLLKLQALGKSWTEICNWMSFDKFNRCFASIKRALYCCFDLQCLLFHKHSTNFFECLKVLGEHKPRMQNECEKIHELHHTHKQSVVRGSTFGTKVNKSLCDIYRFQSVQHTHFSWSVEFLKLRVKCSFVHRRSLNAIDTSQTEGLWVWKPLSQKITINVKKIKRVEFLKLCFSIQEKKNHINILHEWRWMLPFLCHLFHIR